MDANQKLKIAKDVLNDYLKRIEEDLCEATINNYSRETIMHEETRKAEIEFALSLLE